MCALGEAVWWPRALCPHGEDVLGRDSGADFESSAIGPREWDLLPTAIAVDRYAVHQKIPRVGVSVDRPRRQGECQVPELGGQISAQGPQKPEIGGRYTVRLRQSRCRRAKPIEGGQDTRAVRERVEAGQQPRELSLGWLRVAASNCMPERHRVCVEAAAGCLPALAPPGRRRWPAIWRRTTPCRPCGTCAMVTPSWVSPHAGNFVALTGPASARHRPDGSWRLMVVSGYRRIPVGGRAGNPRGSHGGDRPRA
jgi:hypothetical protein